MLYDSPNTNTRCCFNYFVVDDDGDDFNCILFVVNRNGVGDMIKFASKGANAMHCWLNIIYEDEINYRKVKATPQSIQSSTTEK